MSENVRKRGCEGAVAEGTMAPSGTWWTTLGPGTVSLSWIVVMGSIDYFITLLGVEFAVEYGPDHDESKL